MEAIVTDVAALRCCCLRYRRGRCNDGRQSLAARWPSFARLGPLGIESTGAQTASRFRELFMGEAGVLVPAAAAVLAGLGLWASAHPFGR